MTGLRLPLPPVPMAYISARAICRRSRRGRHLARAGFLVSPPIPKRRCTRPMHCRSTTSASAPGFKTATKAADHPVPGPSGLAEAVSGACHPVVAIGGITVETVEAVKAAGASAYAVLSAITQAADIETVVGNLLSR